MKLFAWTTIVFVLALALASTGKVRADQPMLVKAGQPQAQIVIAAQPTRSVKLAARELQTFVEQMTGATLPILQGNEGPLPTTVYIGRSERTQALGVNDDGLRDDGFRIVSGNNWIVLLGRDDDYAFVQPASMKPGDQDEVMKQWDALTGGRLWGAPRLSVHRQYSPALDLWDLDSRGSLNAVYALLRELGVRWYFPGKLGQVIPTAADLPLPKLDRTVLPDFASRHLFIYYSEFFMATPGSDRVDDVRWMLWLGLRQKQHEWGFSGGHGLVAMTSRPEVREKHPEYYALWAGQRAFDTARYGAQCLSSPGLFQETLDYARTIFDHYGDPMINATPGDSYLSLCQCPLCEGKATPQRGWNGQLSDYVWGNVNRIATELYKTHPDHFVSGIAYSTYQLPPEQIERFSPNVVTTICRWRSDQGDPAKRQAFHQLLDAWLAKLPSKRVYLWDYYLHGRPGSRTEGVPVYFPRAIAQDLRHLKGRSRGEYIEVYGNRNSPERPWHELATMHLNCYVTARLWWDVDQDIDALLEEYYERYYGPARAEMKTFIEFSEQHWMKASTDGAAIDRMFELIAAAQSAAGAEGVHRQRIDLIAHYMDRLHQLRARLGKGREGNPVVRAAPRGKPDILPAVIDGKLDEPFWQGVPTHTLVNLQTGAPSNYPTTFQVAWKDDAIYFAVVCKDVPGREVVAAGKSHDDTNVWNGDAIELLLETQVRAYYQLAISPNGTVVDLDRSSGFGMGWTSNAQVATSLQADGWTVEMRLPVVAEGQADVDPLIGVAGRRPHPTYPWYFNLCRQRVGTSDKKKELTAFAPTGKPSFHEPEFFAALIVP